MTTAGAEIYNQSSSEEQERARNLLVRLFLGDKKGRDGFVERISGAGHPVGQSALESHTPKNEAELNLHKSSGDVNHGSNAPHHESERAGLRKLVTTFNKSPIGHSPLTALKIQVENFFTFGPNMASFAFSKLQVLAAANIDQAPESQITVHLSGQDLMLLHHCSLLYPWNSCKMAATLVMLLTAPKDRDSLFAAVKMQSRSLGGLPTLQQIRLTPSASFMTAYQKAKQLALGEVKCTTVIAVNLTDVHIFELAQQGRSEEYFSFAHVFVAAVGPEGVIIWQSWGKYGYRLDEYLRRGDGRLRDWPEADQFVDDFMTLASQNGAWTGKRNRLYKRLFHIDLQKLCGSKGAERPLTPRYEPWVRLHTFEDVKYDDVTKFRWTLS